MRSLEKYVKQYNDWNSIFGKDPIDIPTNRAECKPLFGKLASELSPENLCCDGELPAYKVKIKARHLWAVWADLEKIFGREVNENESWIW